MDRALGLHQQAERTTPANPQSFVIRMRGLPYAALKNDIMQFFSPVVPSNGEDGIHIVRDKDIGRPSGIAYVEFDTEADVNTALSMNRKNMGSRYIELFSSNQAELTQAMAAPHLFQGGPSVRTLYGGSQGYSPYQPPPPMGPGPTGGYGAGRGNFLTF